jgi:hypothetical protein
MLYGGLACLIVLAFTLLGCSDDNGFDNAQRHDLENRTFVFNDGRALDLPDQQVTLAFGAFGLGSQPRSGTVVITRANASGSATCFFFVETEGNVFDGGIDLSPDSTCNMEVRASTLPGVPLGKTIHFDPCDIDDTTGALRLENDATDQVSISNVP